MQTKEKCAEVERLEATHNPLLYKKIEELIPTKCNKR